MKSIPKPKHENLKNALIMLEKILIHEPVMPDHKLHEIADARERLEAVYLEYEILTQKLAMQTRYYEELAEDAKANILRQTLRYLKSKLPTQSLSYERLRDSIRFLKGA